MRDVGRVVFVVDDEEIIASSLAAILEIKGFDAHFFVNPIEALSAAHHVRPKLVISDVVMPEMSGVDLAIRIKETNPDCQILLFSGQAATDDLLTQAREQGHDFELLAKPVHPSILLSKIKL